ncbi:hypothetical protein PV08_09830 [Exophiala spinifera]|uniref:Uncharacterized protein n=1 Tax=Exophiala spinifera TaxID=91928 RepID=A0A0D2B0Z8_9EURO|nr:uncharacterized protein PV08_09830 [Exophiala spinifera]KIW12553.1 hypothetical protein PV08_09830 [Exophiala spinifera]
MPVYLVHGFRWPREGFSGIRVHAIVHNLDDVSTEYIQNEHSRANILDSFHRLYPDIMKELEGPGRSLEFVEQYNPDDVDGPYAASQPYAYVGDKVVTIAGRPGSGNNPPQTSSIPNPTSPTQPSVAAPGQNTDTSATAAVLGGEKESGVTHSTTTTAATATSSPLKSRANTQPSGGKRAGPEETDLSLNVEDVIATGPGLTNKAWEALADLRDKIAPNEKIGWWVVYNGDPERAFDDYDDDDGDEDYDEDDEYGDEEYDYEANAYGNGDDDDEGYELADDERGVQYRGTTTKSVIPRTTATPPPPPSSSSRRKQGHPHSRGSSQQLRPLTASTGTPPTRPMTAPSAGASDTYPPPMPLPLSATSPLIPQPQWQQQQQQQQPQQSGLTALPVRPNFVDQKPKPDTKGKQKEGSREPVKPKETNKTLGLRRKLFGRRG